jgi:hypothetical protein
LVSRGKTCLDFYCCYKILIVEDSFAGLSLSSSNRFAYCRSYYSCAKPLSPP